MKKSLSDEILYEIELDIPQISLQKGETIQDLFERKGNYIYKRVVDAIGLAAYEEFNSAQLFQLGKVDIIEAPRKRWAFALENALEYLIEVEEYEYCQKIVNLKKYLKIK
jgi:hypothetical protein|tara:strand:+ start:1962 stop:2291 length:330 start_codon:yes stop_codon:yes gene_type:complete